MKIDSELRRINQTGIAPNMMESIEDPYKALKVGIDLIKSAKKEVLAILSTVNAFHRQEKMGTINLLKKVTKEKGISVRILTPKDDAIKELSDRINKESGRFHIRFVEPTLQSKISILIVDRTHSLMAELKDDSKDTSYEAIGVSTYSDSKATVLSYASIFESLWATLELHENIKESNKKLQRSNLQLSMAEQKYRNLYEKSPSLLRSITTGGILIDCNEAYVKALGYSKKEAIGMSIYDHTAERSIEDLRGDLEKWKKTQQISHIEIWMKRKDGIIFPTLLNGTSLFDENGNLIGRTVALTDMTAIHKARLKIEEREARLREQFEELKEKQIQMTQYLREISKIKKALDEASIFAVTDKDGTIIDVNQKFCEISKYSREELMGRNHRILKSGYHPPEFYEEIWKTITSGKIWRGDIKNMAKDKTFYWVKTTIMPILDFQGKPVEYVSVRTDITSQKRIEEDLKKALNELKEIGKMQKEFINVAAHELRTPIQPIIGLAESLRDKKGDISSYTHLIDIIIKSGKRLQRVSENILDVTKIESSTFKINKERVNLRELLYDLFQDLYYQLQSNYKEEDVKLQFEAKEDIFVTADRSKLTQVIMNLFNNAIKFTDKGAIVISIEQIPDNALVKVQDTGTGISDTILPQLFTKFTIKSGTGTGLGLFISKSIVEAHGGNMWAKNNVEGKGATFAFTIPNNLENNA